MNIETNFLEKLPIYVNFSAVARPILVVGFISNLVHQGREVQQNDSCLDMGPSLLK